MVEEGFGARHDDDGGGADFDVAFGERASELGEIRE
jgi:hypothetical protein